MVFVHGHQGGDRPGGAVYGAQGTRQPTTSRDIAAVAVSQPGYGQSDGPPDFAGVWAHKAIAAVTEHVRRWHCVLRDRVALYGYSPRAIVGAMIAMQIRHAGALILGAGMYDLADAFRRLDRSVTELDGLAKNFKS